MSKSFIGTVVSTSNANTAVVKIARRVPHPLYRKLMERSKKVKADTREKTVSLGDTVKIAETRPLSKDKHFQVVEVIRKEETQ